MAGHQNTLNGFGFFEIVVDLTQEGMEHVDDIVNIVFQVRKYFITNLNSFIYNLFAIIILVFDNGAQGRSKEVDFWWIC